MYNLNKRHLFFLILISSVINSCGGDNRRQTADDRASGSIKAVILNSGSFNPNISHGQIIEYRVTITGDGIPEPITAEFDGTKSSGVIDNIPAGSDRAITVEAINPNGAKIREGEVSGIEIRSDETVEATIDMESVPIFANLSDGSVVPNTRFIAKIFSDPRDQVAMEDEFNGSSAGTQAKPDASTGIAQIIPPVLSVGEHRLTVRNVATGRNSTVNILLTDGTKIKGAPIFSAGSNMPARFGQVTRGDL